MKNLSFLLLYFLFHTVFSQNYDLNSYSFRFQKWQAFGVNFDLNGNKNIAKYQSENKIRTLFSDSILYAESRYSSYQSTFKLPLFYNSNINTDKIQQIQSAGFNSYINSSTNSIKSEHILNYLLVNRFYNNKNFTELNFNTNNMYGTDRVKNSGSYSLINLRNLDLSYTISIGKGRGRLEYISDAVSALFLLNDLKKKSVIKEYSNAQMEEIAKGFTFIRNRRYLDFRFKVIDQLSMLDSILKLNHIVSDQSLQLFTALNDNLLYATQFARYSGSRWSILIKNDGRIANVYETRESPDSILNLDHIRMGRSSFNGINLNFTHSKQIGLNIQSRYEFNLESGVQFYTGEYTQFTSKQKSDIVRNTISGEYALLFQPNSRTYFTGTAKVSYAVQNDLNGMRVSNKFENHETYNSVTANLSFTYFRFISARLYYSASSNLGFNSNSNNYSSLNNYYSNYNSNNLGLSYSMGLTYLFF